MLEHGERGNRVGRQKGSLNKTHKQLREMISGFLENNFELVQSNFSGLTPKEQLQYWQLLAEMVIPKRSAVEVETLTGPRADLDLEALSVPQMKAIADIMEGRIQVPGLVAEAKQIDYSPVPEGKPF
jgi:hypothetical protein